MIASDVSLFGLSDAGAHCGAICDASMTTSYLTLWARDRDDGLPWRRWCATSPAPRPAMSVGTTAGCWLPDTWPT